MAGDDDATKVLDVTKDFGDRLAAVVAWHVPASDRYPEGIKYSMQYGNVGGETIVRYDNLPGPPGRFTPPQTHARRRGGGRRVRHAARPL